MRTKWEYVLYLPSSSHPYFCSLSGPADPKTSRCQVALNFNLLLAFKLQATNLGCFLVLGPPISPSMFLRTQYPLAHVLRTPYGVRSSSPVNVFGSYIELVIIPENMCRYSTPHAAIRRYRSQCDHRFPRSLPSRLPRFPAYPGQPLPFAWRSRIS